MKTDDPAQADEMPIEDTDEYGEGRVACRDGVSVNDNPHPSGKGMNNQRYRWFVGWYDERMKHLTGADAENLEKVEVK